ncbi:hypothetical protein SUGI_0765180 [Cryptomeria japonica]|nr:hypothetical protein SUGI_0765180 [Cryptomeria japonica]
MGRFCSTPLMAAWFSLSGLSPLDVVQWFADLMGHTAAMPSWASGMRRKTQSQVAALEGETQFKNNYGSSPLDVLHRTQLQCPIGLLDY